MIIDNKCALQKIKELADNSQDIIFADPPYALGSSVFIDTDGKPKYKTAKDFMNKWDMPDHNFWEDFFKESNRVLKFGGRVLLFGIDRQLMLFQYYATMAGLQTNQSMYWTFASSFPKATDVYKMLDKKQEFTSDKYDGYRYSICPLKQVVETIMVFQKETKNNSNLDDIIAYENGDLEISPSIWNIDGSRVPTDEIITNHSRSAESAISKGIYGNSKAQETHQTNGQKNGRYPSQLFIDETVADKLDLQSGILTSGARKSEYVRRGKNPNETYGKFNEIQMDDAEKDSGGLSRMFHKIGYLDDEVDLTIYSSKVSGLERNAGLGEFVDIEVGVNNHSNPIGIKTTQINTSSGKLRNATEVTKNNHPTLKPIRLIYNIAKLLKTPNKQNVFFPFSGTGSEIIGFIKAGFDKESFEASELSNDYIKIADARIKHWETVDINTYIDKKVIKQVESSQETDSSLEDWL